MRDPAFWWRPAGLAAAILSPVGAIYGAVAGSRMARPGRTAGVPVVCIGNLTLGGAGKTPAAILAAQILAGVLPAPPSVRLPMQTTGTPAARPGRAMREPATAP